MTITVEVFRRFEEVPGAYDPLFADHGTRDVFLSRDWFSLLSAHGVPADTEIEIYGVRHSDGTPLLLLPLTVEDGQHDRHHLRNFGNFYSLSFAPLTSAAASGSLLAQAFASVAQHLHDSGIVQLHLRPVRADNTSLAELSKAFSSAGFAIRQYRNATEHFAITGDKSADDYLATLPSRLKNTVARKTRGNGHAFRVHRSAQNLEQALADYNSIYERSWKEAEPYPGFMPALIRTAAKKGMLRLGIWLVDGQPAASQVWFVYGGQAVIYKLAHDKAFDHLSVGSAITLKMFATIIEEDAPQVISFGLGDETYKTDWTPQTRPYIGWVAFRRSSLSGRLALLRHDLGRWRQPNTPRRS